MKLDLNGSLLKIQSTVNEEIYSYPKYRSLTMTPERARRALTSEIFKRFEHNLAIQIQGDLNRYSTARRHVEPANISDSLANHNPRVGADVNCLVAVGCFHGEPGTATWSGAMKQAYTVKNELEEKYKIRWDWKVPWNLLSSIRSPINGRWRPMGRISGALLEVIELGQLLWAIYKAVKNDEPLTKFDEFLAYKMTPDEIKTEMTEMEESGGVLPSTPETEESVRKAEAIEKIRQGSSHRATVLRLLERGGVGYPNYKESTANEVVTLFVSNNRPKQLQWFNKFINDYGITNGTAEIIKELLLLSTEIYTTIPEKSNTIKGFIEDLEGMIGDQNKVAQLKMIGNLIHPNMFSNIPDKAEPSKSNDATPAQVAPTP